MKHFLQDIRRHRAQIISLFKSRPSVDLGIDVDDRDMAIIAAIVVGFVLYIVTVNSI
ncbi:hypothetical protein [Parasphingorhabdus sp.]|uniref:hypothetical protein n=1 Tax=Parasphingorhabdus sp. TaxID=2709688 RepID=UPI003A909DC5